MMREIDEILYGVGRGRSVLGAVEAAQQDDADDDFEQWLASLSPDAFGHILDSLLHHEPDAPAGRPA